MSRRGDKVKKRAVYVGIVLVVIVLILFFVSKFAIKDFKEFFGFEFGGKDSRAERSEVEGAKVVMGLDANAVREKVGKAKDGGEDGEEGDKRLKGVYYALIGIVGVLVVAIIVLVVWYFVEWRRRGMKGGNEK